MEDHLASLSRHVDIQTPAGVLRVQPVTPHIFRIRVQPGDKEPSLIRYGILRSQWPDVPFTTERADGITHIVTSEAQVAVNENDGTIVLLDSAGSSLVRQTTPPESGVGS